MQESEKKWKNILKTNKEEIKAKNGETISNRLTKKKYRKTEKRTKTKKI